MMLSLSLSAYENILKPSLRPLYHAVRLPISYLKARKISREYAAQHRRAQDFFASRKASTNPIIKSLSEIKVRILNPEGNGFVVLPDRYLNLVRQIRDDVQVRFEVSGNCLFFPKLKISSVPRCTKDISAIKNGEIISVQLKDYLGIRGLEELCSGLMGELERKVFLSHVIVDKVYIYRSLPTHQEAQVSWLWHYDNHPNEILKIMIYLSDVDEKSGPFEYLRSTKSHEAAFIHPRPLFDNSRISPKAIKRYLLDGYDCRRVTGPRGTMILFDNNVVHRASLAKSVYRDVIVLQIRPATFCPRSYIDPQWTGSFQHVDFNPNPYDYHPREKPRMLSG